MKYFDEMQTKWGFADGEAVPSGAEHYRTAYILAVNALAVRTGSEYRAYAFDRGGMHNWCLILFTCDQEAREAEPVSLTLTDGGIGPSRYTCAEKCDDAMDRAVELAHDKEIDGYVAVTVQCSEAAEILADMAKTEMKTEDEEEG